MIGGNIDKKQKEAEYFKWKGTIDRNPDYYQTETDRIAHGCPEWCWDKYNEELENDNIKDIFDNIKEAINYYLDMPEDKKTIIALWIMGTYIHDKFETYPYIFLNAMRGSGKTRTIKLITKLSKDGEMMMSMTEAGLFRTKGTLGIDEFEGHASKEKQALREVLNASYKKGVKIVRMKKKKTIDGENIEAEYFESYRPIVMANIWGVEEVLGDRSITIILEKSNNDHFTRIIENYDDNPIIKNILLLLNSDKCRLCRVVSPENIKNDTKWNEYVKNKTALTTLTTYNTLTTLTTQEIEMFDKIYESGINGRDLELYFPLFTIANIVSKETFEEVLEIAKNNVEAKREEDVYESTDINLYQTVSECSEGFVSISGLVSSMRKHMGDGNWDWLNAKWMGRGLKRLNLVIEKKRMSDGRYVRVDVPKAKKQLEMFK